MRTAVLRRYLVQYWARTLRPLCGGNSILTGAMQLQVMRCTALLQRAGVSTSKPCAFLHPLSRCNCWSRARRQQRLNLHRLSQRHFFRGLFDVLHPMLHANVQRPARLHIGGFLRELWCSNI